MSQRFLSKLRFLVLALVSVGSLSASASADTIDLDWEFGISPAAASTTINVGDTVTWTWTDGLTHTVTSTSGAFFDSGFLTGLGTTFSHTFTSAGSFPYDCTTHPSMVGTITVVAAVPAVTAPMVVLLIVGILCVGAWMLKRRAALAHVS